MATFNFLGTTVTCHNSWDSFFNNPVVTGQNGYLAIIEGQIINSYLQNNITPHVNNIFKVFQMDLNECKIVILGQDPYPQRSVATGRAFEVGNITRWEQLREKEHNNPSLRNILKLLHKNYNYPKTGKPESIGNVIRDISFILPPNQLFNHWEQQGVLLLNTAFTCEIDNSNSHSNFWGNFTEEVINFVDTNTQGLTWFLWGSAKKLCHLIFNGTKYYTEHPRINNDNNFVQGTFYYDNHFSEVPSIDWYGI
ncbi:hypothetical protein BCS42_14925 [Crenothrix sp. D3]|nr:hypothetical protein BCS42_14925 [Crenothrix sp. D3]